jgi:hypothetical protein
LKAGECAIAGLDKGDRLNHKEAHQQCLLTKSGLNGDFVIHRANKDPFDSGLPKGNPASLGDIPFDWTALCSSTLDVRPVACASRQQDLTFQVANPQFLRKISENPGMRLLIVIKCKSEMSFCRFVKSELGLANGETGKGKLSLLTGYALQK